MKKILRATVLVLSLSFILISAAQAQTPQQTLNQYVADLQKNPNDYALREKIIKHVQAMRPKPAVPEEAQKYMDRGLAAIEGGKGEEDFRAASAEFSKAVNLAPWLGDAYRNLAIAQDKSGQYDAALKNLRLYLLTSPLPADEAWAKSLINKVEYRKEKAAKEPSRQSAAAPKQNTFDDLLRKIDGRRYTCIENGWLTSVLDVRGRTIVRGTIENGRYLEWTGEASRVEIRGRETTVPLYYRPFKVNAVSMTFLISEDGYSITGRTRFSDGDSRDYIHLWQK